MSPQGSGRTLHLPLHFIIVIVILLIITITIIIIILIMIVVTVTVIITSNVTGRHRGPKQKLQAGYRAPSLKRMAHVVIRFHHRVWYRTLSLCYACT